MKLDILRDLILSQKDDPDGDFKTPSGNIVKAKEKDSIVGESIQAFIHKIAKGTKAAALQAFSGSSDLPLLTNDVFNVTAATPNYDLGWQRAFRGVTLSKGELSWEIDDVEDFSEFKIVEEGSKVEIGSAGGKSITVKTESYGRGIGFTWRMMEARKLWPFVDALTKLRDKLYLLWANVHYGLLALAAASTPIAWGGVGTDTTLARDVQTLNTGAATITSATKDKGYGDTAMAQLLIYVSPLLRARIDAAIAATRDNLIKGGVQQAAPVSWPIDAIYTYNSKIPENKGVMVLPGNKIQNAVYLQEQSYSKTDIESRNEIRTYWSEFGAIVADNDQCAELAFA